MEEKLTVNEVLKEIRWFPVLFSSIVGVPSFLAILEAAILDFRLSIAFQWIIDGYNLFSALLARTVEPFVLPIINMLSSYFQLELMLYPHWRPLALISISFGLVSGRLPLLQSSWHLWCPRNAIMILGAIFAGIAGGLFAPDRFLPILIAYCFVALPFYWISLLFIESFEIVLRRHIASGLPAIFLLCAYWYLFPDFELLIIGSASDVLIFVFGSYGLFGIGMMIFGLLAKETGLLRYSLGLLGVYITTGMVLAADAILKLLF